MRLTALTDATAYRMHAPRWAVAPTSGAGAGKYGGHWRLGDRFWGEGHPVSITPGKGWN